MDQYDLGSMYATDRRQTRIMSVMSAVLEIRSEICRKSQFFSYPTCIEGIQSEFYNAVSVQKPRMMGLSGCAKCDDYDEKFTAVCTQYKTVTRGQTEFPHQRRTSVML